MIKTEWIPATTKLDGHWEVRHEPTGELKQGLFKVHEVTAPVQKWVEGKKLSPNIVDGEKLARDIEAAANRLIENGFSICQITPVISGRYDYQTYDSHSNAASTAASWGYSITEGVVIVASKNGVQQ